MKPLAKRILRRFLYVVLGVILLIGAGTYSGYRYAMAKLFRDSANTLSFVGELRPVPFEWSAERNEAYVEPHSAVLIPVSVPGIPNTLYMQFDTGSPNSFLNSGPLESLKNRGISFELFKKDNSAYIREFELDVAGNRVLIESGWVRGRNSEVDWDTPDAKNIIGSFGADFLDQKICEIDFPAQEIRLHPKRSPRLDALGVFSPFKFKGRRIMLPAVIDGRDVEVFYDSGCSAFGLLTSKYQYDELTHSSDREIEYDSSRHGEAVPIHHKSSELQISIGSADLQLKRISYAELYAFLQSTVGRFIGGGFLGNKCLTESTLILDTKANEFLVVPKHRPELPLTRDE